MRTTKNLSPLIKEIVLGLPDGENLDLVPGCYVQVTAPPYRCQFANFDIGDDHRDTWKRLGVTGLSVDSDEAVTRAYSTANLPSDSGQIVLLIRLALPPPGKQQQVPPGIVSSWLFQLRQGDQITIGGPYTEFFTRRTNRDMVFIGGGVGMAPLRSMIHHELSSGNTRPISFFYGARSLEDLFYVEEFNQLAQRYVNFSWTAALSDPEPGDHWDGPTGFIHNVVQRQYIEQHSRPDKSDYYLCGPPLMQRAVVSMLDDAGVDDSTIFADNFGV